MKKTIPFLVFASLLFFTTHAQDNKPEPNSFGMQYGVTFGSNITQSVLFTGWIKNNIEVRGALSFSASGNNTTQDNSYGNNISTTVYRYSNLSFLPSVSVVKHFPVKSKLDFFVGGSANIGFSTPTADQFNSYTQSYTNYYHFESTTTKNPMTINFGVGAVGGANFFFYKNLALGADVSLGLGASKTVGKRTTTQVNIDNGSNNSVQQNISNTTSYSASGFNYNFGLNGYAGLHLIYYLKVNKHPKGETKI